MSRTGPQTPVFIASVRYCHDLAGAVEASGRAAVTCNRTEDVARAFAQSTASIALVDVRSEPHQGLRLVRQIAPVVQSRRGAMLVLLASGDADALAEVYEAGATHYLVDPFGGEQLAQSLRFAERYVRRLHSSGASTAVVSAQAALADTARWQWVIGEPAGTISPTLAAMLGQPFAGPIDLTTVLRRLPTPERLKIRRELRRLLVAGVSGDIEHRLPVDGAMHSIVHHVRPLKGADGEPIGLTATVEDLDALMLDRRLSAHFDPLTGLANQSYARAWIDQLLGGRSAHDPACLLVQIAISRFDQVNASYGRSMADALLQAVARRLRRVAGGEDAYGERMLIARLAGAEFAVAFAAPVELAEATHFSERLGEAFGRPFVVGGRTVHLSCRMGIAVGEPATEGADILFRRAGAALAQAKMQEPNSYQIFMPGDADDLQQRMADLETDLRRALENGELDIVYQPQVAAQAGQICGVEALVRWRHPALGLLPAETLLDVARSAELTARLSEHIMRKALTEAAEWAGTLAGLRLSVNVTAEDLDTEDFDALILTLLRETGFPVERLTLEVTESGLMENLDRAALALASLRELGVRIAIDDFGTGYSSLAYLKALPTDYIKIDRQLVVDVVASARGRVVVGGIVDMAHSLGMSVVAEGVETPEQLDILIGEGCDQYQGFLCAQPMTGAELGPFVDAWDGNRAAA